ncbi:MAG: hypothetical protein NT027_05885 [Proteobacteria bacterium]|nr:hypothetical protein [Pseudomonadota bacterium]
MKSKILYTVLTAYVQFQSGIVLSSEQEGAELADFKSFIESSNHYSPLEGAGSHGSLGLGIGVGTGFHQSPEHRQLIAEQFQERDQFDKRGNNSFNDTYLVPRLFIHKGLSIPIDFGASFAKMPATSASSVASYMQWTVFESFALPAISMRGKYSRLMGLPSTEFQSLGLEGTISYGFFRFFNVYATQGVNKNDLMVRTSGESATALVLDSDQDYSSKYMSKNTAFGLQLLMLPLYSTATLEYRKIDTGRTHSVIGKLSLGI